MKRQSKSDKFLKQFADKRKVLVLSHNNPDPDAIASVWAAAYLLRLKTKCEVVIAYSGILGRAENRAMVKYSGERFLKMSDLDLQSFDGVVLVDCQPKAGNVQLPHDVNVTAVIDHHPKGVNLREVPYVDVRSDRGSCIGLILEYMIEQKIHIDQKTSTLFYYALKSETNDLGRGASPKDIALYRKFVTAVDWSAVHAIGNAPVPRSYFASFKIALEKALLYKNALFVDVGELTSPDAIAELADWLLRLDEVQWTLICGTYRGMLLFSLRSLVIGTHCGRLAQEMMAGWGDAGGHGMLAGGQIRLSKTSYDRDEAISELKTRLLKVLKIDEGTELEDPFALQSKMLGIKN